MKGAEPLDQLCRAVRVDGSVYSPETHPIAQAIESGKEVHGIIMGVLNPITEKTRWIDIQVAPRFDNFGNASSQVSIVFGDITQLKVAMS